MGKIKLLDQYGNPINNEPEKPAKSERPVYDQVIDFKGEPETESICQQCKSGKIMMSCEVCEPGMW